MSDIGPTHVLFLIDVLASTAGGAEGILLKITRALPKDRFRCSIATFSPDPDAVPTGQFDCPIHKFPINRTYDWKAFKAAKQLSRLIRAERYPIVHTFFPASDLLGGAVAKLSGTPILISSRRDMGLLRSAPHHLVYRLFAGLFDQVQAVGEEVRRFHILHDGLDPNKVVTIYNGVDLAQIDAVPAGSWPSDLRLAADVPVVVCVANVRPVKGIDILLRTAALVCQEVPEARFLVIGAMQPTKYVERIIALARELRIEDKVIFAGVRQDVPRLLKASRVFFLPSRSEGLSNAMLEAMACSLPCVCTNVGGNSELVEHEGNGYLVPTENPGAARDRIVSLLRDFRLCQSMGGRSRQIVAAKFSLDRMIDRLGSLYDGLLAARKGAVVAGRIPALGSGIEKL